jgi:hypothetical protein
MKKIRSIIGLILIILFMFACTPIVTSEGNKLFYKNQEYSFLGFGIYPHYSLTWIEIDSFRIKPGGGRYGYYIFAEDKETKFLYSDARGLYALTGSSMPNFYDSEIKELIFRDEDSNRICEDYSDMHLKISDIIGTKLERFEDWKGVSRCYMNVIYKEEELVMYCPDIINYNGRYYLSINISDFERYEIKKEYVYLFENRYFKKGIDY